MAMCAQGNNPHRKIFPKNYVTQTGTRTPSMLTVEDCLSSHDLHHRRSRKAQIWFHDKVRSSGSARILQRVFTLSHQTITTAHTNTSNSSNTIESKWFCVLWDVLIDSILTDIKLLTKILQFVTKNMEGICVCWHSFGALTWPIENRKPVTFIWQIKSQSRMQITFSLTKQGKLLKNSFQIRFPEAP